MWDYEATDDYVRAQKWYAKKLPRELAAANDNLEAYVRALELGTNPINASFGYLHNERHGLFAVDQKTNNTAPEQGKKKQKLSVTRLYFYPEVETHTLWLLTIGDKDSQQDDIKKCHKFIEGRRKEVQHEINRQKIQQSQGSDPRHDE